MSRLRIPLLGFTGVLLLNAISHHALEAQMVPDASVVFLH